MRILGRSFVTGSRCTGCSHSSAFDLAGSVIAMKGRRQGSSSSCPAAGVTSYFAVADRSKREQSKTVVRYLTSAPGSIEDVKAVDSCCWSEKHRNRLSYWSAISESVRAAK